MDEHAGAGPGFAEDLAQHRQVQPEGAGETEALRQAGGVDVHDHVHQRLDLCGATGTADVTDGFPERPQDRFGAGKGLRGAPRT